jgi:hypothetical protein
MRTSLTPLALEIEHVKRFREVRFRERRVYRHGLRDGCRRLLADLGGRRPAIHAINPVAVRQAGIRQRVPRIQGDGLLEALDGDVNRGRRSLVPVVTAFEVELVGLEVRRGAPHGEGRLTEQRRHQGAHDRLDDLVLNLEHVGHLAVVALGPELVSGRDTHELCRDAQLRAGPPHAPLEHARDVELLADRTDVELAAAKAKRRRPRRHVHAGQRRECVDEVLGEAVAEVLVVGVAAPVHERHHG